MDAIEVFALTAADVSDVPALAATVGTADLKKDRRDG